MPTSIDSIVNLGLKKYIKTQEQSQNIFYMKIKKIRFFGVIIILFQVYDEPLQMVIEDIVRYLNTILVCLYCFRREEMFFLILIFWLKYFFIS